MTVAIPPERKTILKPGIGLCDDCGEPRWPQEYVGYGMMVCVDCLAKDAKFYESSRDTGGGLSIKDKAISRAMKVAAMRPIALKRQRSRARS